MEIRPLEREDVPAATRLSTQAGWNQLPADWHRFLDLSPAGCHAGWVDDELVATTTVIDYEARESGRVGWIGMVLVDEAHRREGYGSTIFQHALTSALDRGVEDVGLDATDAGRAVYSQLDFVDVMPIERWSGSLAAVAADSDGADHDVELLSAGDLDDIAVYDRAACGADRSDLFESVLSADASDGFALFGTDGPRGYAILRPGRTHWHLGPIVVERIEGFGTLLSAAADHLAGEPVIVDPFATQTITDLLSRYGLERQRRLTRMTYIHERSLLMGDGVVAAAGFEWG